MVKSMMPYKKFIGTHFKKGQDDAEDEAHEADHSHQFTRTKLTLCMSS